MQHIFKQSIKEVFGIEVHEDKFRDSLIIQQDEDYCPITWNGNTPIEKRRLINAHKPDSFNSSGYESMYGNILDIEVHTPRLVTKEGETKVYFDLKGQFQHNKRMDELILRVNNERNYPLPLAYYNVTEIGDEWEWLHEWGFELSVELLKELCDADHVCDSWESNYIWQTNAQLVYSLAFDTDKYYNDFIDYFNYCEEYRKQKEEEKKRKEERIKKEKEEQEQEKESKKRKATIWKRIAILGVLLFVGGIYGCGESDWSWLWMSLIGAITAFVGFVAYEFCD
jgi:hypothetical protein